MPGPAHPARPRPGLPQAYYPRPTTPGLSPQAYPWPAPGPPQRHPGTPRGFQGPPGTPWSSLGGLLRLPEASRRPAWGSQRSPGALGGSQRLPGAPRSSQGGAQGLPGASWGSLGGWRLPEPPRGSRRPPGAPRGLQGLPEAPRCSQGLPGPPQAYPWPTPGLPLGPPQPCQPNRLSLSKPGWKNHVLAGAGDGGEPGNPQTHRSLGSGAAAEACAKWSPLAIAGRAPRDIFHIPAAPL